MREPMREFLAKPIQGLYKQFREEEFGRLLAKVLLSKFTKEEARG